MKHSIFDESADFVENKSFKTINFSYDICCKHIDIKNTALSEINKLDFGKYYIINSPKLFDYGIKVYNETKKIFTKYLVKLIEELNFKKDSSVLIVGLGNSRINSDALGFEVFSSILMSRGLMGFSNLRNVCGIAPDIYAKTGIESFDIVSSIVNFVNPDFVFVVDSLATSEINRLGCSFQITNSSLSAGSAMGSGNKTFSKETLNTECIFLGVPLMLKYEDTFLTPNDIDIKLKKCSSVIYEVLNQVLHPYFSEKEIKELL